MCSSNSAKQAMAPNLLEVVEQGLHKAPLVFSILVGLAVESESEHKTMVMMGRFVPDVFDLLASVRTGRCYVSLQQRIECVCI